MRKFLLEWSLALRFFRAPGAGLGASTWVALGGLALGVASLVVSMAVVSGFESSLKKHILEMTGHLQVVQMGSRPLSAENLWKTVKELDPQLKAYLPFLRVEALAASKGKISGVFLQGLGSNCCVLQLPKKVVQGSLAFLETSGEAKSSQSEVAIGKGLAGDLQLQVGDLFQVVLPLASTQSSLKFRRKNLELKVAAILDLGKHEFNQRSIVTSLASLQDWAEVGGRILGLLLLHESDEAALRSSRLLSRQLPPQLRVWDWKETNSTLFQAVETEKPILFFVIGLMVLAASVNVAASLNIQVASKTPQLSTLRALGLPSASVLRVFMNQGLILGLIGSLLGLILGLLFCALFSWLEKQFGILPVEVYKIDSLQVDLRWKDLAAILSLSIGLSTLAVFRSARRAAFLRPAEGLRYE